MKKLIALAVMAVTMVSAAFALDFEVGGRVFLGTDLAKDASFQNMGAQISDIGLDSNLSYGFGAYANFALLAGLGVQAEANLTKGSLSLNNVKDAESFSTLVLDVPAMLWWNLKIWRLGVGLGAGPNFSFDLSNGDLPDQAVELAKNNAFRVGLSAGADAKFYVTKHVGIIGSGRFVMDFGKKEVPVVVSGYDTGMSYPTVQIARRSLYGGLGVEWKLF